MKHTRTYVAASSFAFSFAALATAFGTMTVQAESMGLGVGVAQVRPDAERPLYFYGSRDAAQYPPTAAPQDSVTFSTGPHHIDIATAPPWFAPENMKLDYDLLYLRAVRLSRYGVEVVVNSSDPLPRSFPRTKWVLRDNVEFRTWTEFLLEVFSVETIDPASNPVRSRPGEDFPAVGPSDGKQWLVRSVEGSWIEVEDVNGTEAETLRGWIRWRHGDELLITYSLLS